MADRLVSSDVAKGKSEREGRVEALLRPASSRDPLSRQEAESHDTGFKINRRQQ